MRALLRARSRASGIPVLAALLAILLVPSAAAAKPAVKISKLGKPPTSAVESGKTFRLTATLRNRSNKATRPSAVVRLHSTRKGNGRRVASRQLPRLRAGRKASIGVRVRVPASMAAGRYFATLCVKSRGGTACRLAGRRLTVIKPPAPNPNPNPNPQPQPEPGRFDVLVFTETGVDDANSEYHESTPAGVAAVQQLGKDQKFGVTVAEDSKGVFTEDNLKKYRVVLFLNVSGNVLDGVEQHAFERYYRAGGGFLAVHGAIGAEPNWDFMDELLGTRATGSESELGEATIKVADRTHDATKVLPIRWKHTDQFPNFTGNVRGESHVLATVDETTYEGGTMGADHPVSWCKDYQGGRSFYTGAGHTDEAFADAELRKHLAGAIDWTAGKSDAVYSDCGQTIWANFQQTKISAPPNVNEPIGFDQLPDGRIIQTVRDGRVRLHDPVAGTSTVIATLPVYTHSEDGLYGPAVDNDFAQNKWVYLFYAPQTMDGTAPDGDPYPTSTPPGAAPTQPQASLDAWDQWAGYFQLSRFKFVDGPTPSLDLASEQEIMRMHVERGACCHVAGDIDFDKDNNLWLVTGDDTPAGGGNSGGWGPMNDLKTNETQIVRAFNATGGTFTLSFGGETTPPLPYNATPAAVQAALEAFAGIAPGDLAVTGTGNTPTANTGNITVVFGGQFERDDVPLLTADSSALTQGTPPTATAPAATTTAGGATANEVQTVRTLNATGGTWTITYAGQTTAPLPWNASADEVRLALEALSNLAPGDVIVAGGPAYAANITVTFAGTLANTDVAQLTTDATALTTAPLAYTQTTIEADLFQPPWFDARRSSLNTNDLRGKVLRIKVAEDGSYTSVPGNLFTGNEEGGGKTRPEIYAMGFRNPFRIQVDSDGVAYVTDYSPDSNVPGGLRGPAGTGRVEIVRKPTNYGWPQCMSPTLPMYQWDYNMTRTLGTRWSCGDATQGPPNTSRHNTGLAVTPPLTQPDVWYSFQDTTWGTPCLDSYDEATIEACPNLFPELGTGGVGPHGATKYEYDPANPNPTKFPPYYDDTVFFGEFTRDYLREFRLDEQNQIYKINDLLSCGALGNATVEFECDNPMDMQFGKDGHFYLLTYGDGFFAANPDAGMYKWEYVKGQRAPQAVLSADVTNGIAPLTVEFSSEGSRDPDPSDSIEFAWDFQSDGIVDSTDPDATYTYTQNGVYTARLTVRDSSGKTATATTTITVGNTAPTVEINTPLDGDFFAWGDNIPYSVTVTDPEDAAIDCSRVITTFVLVHDQHGHGEASASGCNGVLPTSPDDASHGGWIAGGISVSYTDTGANGQPALTTTTQHVVQTRRQQVEYAQQQSGTGTGNSGEPDPFGGQVRNGLDDGDWIAINRSVNLTNMDKTITFRFANNAAAGSDRVNVEVHLDSPTGPIATTATLKATGNNNTYTSQTFPLNFTGSRRLYLVFKPVAGGVTTGFGNLNWVEFTGAGHGQPPGP